MPDLAELMLVVNSSQVSVANNNMNIMVQVAGQAEVAIKGLGDQTAKTDNVTKQANGTMGEMLKTVIALAGAYGTLQTIREAISMASTEDRLQKGFSNILQSVEQANDVLAQLKDYSASSQFQFAGLADATREFMSLGMSAKDAVTTIKVIGNELQTLGSDADNIDSISRAFRIMLETGQANMYIFRSLASQGIPAIQILAKALGVDTVQAYDLVRKGAIDGNAAVKVLTEGMAENVNAAKDTHETYVQLWQEIKNNLLIALGDIAKQLLDDAKAGEMLKDVINIIKDLHNHLDVIVEVLKAVALIIGALVALQLVAWLSSIVSAGSSLITMLVTIVGNLVPLLTILAAIAAFEFARYLVEQFASVRKAVDTTGAYLDAWWTTVKGEAQIAISFIQKLWDNLLISIDNGIVTMLNKAKLLAAFATAAGYGDNPLVAGLNSALNSPTATVLSAALSTDASARTQQLATDTKQLIDAQEKLGTELRAIYQGWKNDMADIDKEYAHKSHSFTDFIKSDFTTALQAIASGMGKAGELIAPALNKAFPQLGGLGALLKQMASDPYSSSGGDFGSQGETGSSVGADQLIRITEQLNNQLDKTIQKVREEADTLSLLPEVRERELKIMQMMELLKEHGISSDRPDAQAFLKQLDEAISKLQTLKELDTVGKDLGNSFSNAFGEFVSGAKSAQQAAKDFVTQLDQMLLKDLVLKNLANMIESGVVGLGSGLFSGGSTGTTTTLETGQSITSGVYVTQAMGGVWSQGIRYFAQGDIISSPTPFSTAGGMGVMGEAGPEAVMPLTRGPNGKLGVAATGGSTVHNHYWNITTPSPDGFRRSARQVAQVAQRAVGGR